MKLESIEVHRLPGIERPYRVDGLSGGVNLIVGPNGAGKSSLCRAVDATLWPEAARPDDEVTTVWQQGGARLRARLAGAVRWTDASGRDGAPVLPDPEMRRCLILGLRDLLESGASEDRVLAERLRVQMAGGFDLRAAASEFSLRRTHGRAEAKELEEARRACHELQGRRNELAADFDSLAALEVERAEARRAERELGRLRAAGELARMRDELAAQQHRLAAYPRAMEALRGDELGRLKDLDRELETVLAGGDEARGRLESAERELERCGLASGPIARTDLNTWLSWARELAQGEQEAARLAVEVRAAEDALAGAFARLGADAARLGSGPELEVASLERWDAWIADALAARQKRELLEARLAVARVGWQGEHELVDDQRLAEHARGVRLLEEWLVLQAERPPRSTWLRAGAGALLTGGLAGGLVKVAAIGAEAAGELASHWLAALGSASVVLTSPWGAPFVAGAFGLVGFSLARPRSRRHAQRKLEHRYTALVETAGLAPLSEGRGESRGESRGERGGGRGESRGDGGVDQVGQRLRELQAALQRSDEAKARRRDAEGIAHELALLQSGEQGIEARRRELSDQLGVEPASGDLAVADLLDRLRRYRSRCREAESARGSLEACRSRCAERSEALRAKLVAAGAPVDAVAVGPQSAHGTADSSAGPSLLASSSHENGATHPPAAAGGRLDAATVLAALDDLKDRSTRWEQAEGEGAAARRDFDRARQQGDDIVRRRVELLRAAQVEGPDLAAARRTLEERCGELEGYRKVRSAVRDIEARMEGLQSSLSEAPELAALSREEIAERAERSERLAERREPLSSRIALIEERVRCARAGDELECALAAEREAAGALADRRAEQLRSVAGGLLMEDVEAEYEEHSRPAVLERAMALFEAFSEHRYSLRLASDEAGDSSFCAVEAASGRELRLSELSDGTRMQLLLAARLAFSSASHFSVDRSSGGESVASSPPDGGVERRQMVLLDDTSQSPRRGTAMPASARTAGPESDALPLFLDEALTASDPSRFRAVVESLLWLAEQGRQVFYLTCSPADVAYWQAIAHERGAPAPHVVDLSEVRRLEARAATGARLEAPVAPAIPAPGAASAAAYGAQLGVDVPGPLSPVGSLHLFHLLRDDLPLLHRLLSEVRIERVGHWRLLARGSRGACGLTAEEVAKIDAWVALAERFFAEVAVGRGAAVDRAVLHASGAVSGQFLDRLSELASDLRGDARALLDALERGEDERAKRFLKRNRSKLAAYLREHGHLTDEAPHTLPELRVRCLDTLAGPIEESLLSAREVTERVDQLYALVVQDKKAPLDPGVGS